MRTSILPLIILCFFGLSLKSIACSPAAIPFQDLLNAYNPRDYIIIEGYFKPTEGKYFASKFEIIRSSDSLFKAGKEYEVFEYGPFGSTCEMYEMEANVDPKLVGKNKPRLLIVYKERSVNNKLITPIFWQAGVNASNNRIVTRIYHDQSKEYKSYECATPLNELWKLIFSDKELKLNWKESTDESVQN